MSTIALQPMEWSATPDIDEVRSYSDEDAVLFRELRDVLRKHDALDRFGLTLIHKHFDIAPDEAMVEYTDHENRALVTKPVKKSEFNPDEFTVTNWRLTDGDVVAERTCHCARTSDGHTGGHGSY